MQGKSPIYIGPFKVYGGSDITLPKLLSDSDFRCEYDIYVKRKSLVDYGIASHPPSTYLKFSSTLQSMKHMFSCDRIVTG